MSWHYCVYVLVRFRYTGKDQVLPWNSGFGHQQHGWCPDFSSKKKSCRHKHSWHLSPSLLLKISRVVISLFCCIFFLFIFLNKRCKGLEIFSAFRLVCPHFLNSLHISKDQVPVSQVSHTFLSEMNGLHVTFGSCTDRKPLRKYQTVTRTCSLKSFSILKLLLSNNISWRKPGGRCWGHWQEQAAGHWAWNWLGKRQTALLCWTLSVLHLSHIISGDCKCQQVSDQFLFPCPAPMLWR